MGLPVTPRARIHEIIAEVGHEFGVTLDDILNGPMEEPLVSARKAAMYATRRVTGRTYQQLGRIFGRHYTTVYNGYRWTSSKRRKTVWFKAKIDALIERLQRDYCVAANPQLSSEGPSQQQQNGACSLVADEAGTPPA